MTQIVCKDTHKRRDYKIKLHLFTFIQLINRSFACGEVREVREVRGKLRDKCQKGLTSRPALHILSKIQIGMT